MDSMDRMLEGTTPIEDLVSSKGLEELQREAQRVRNARWAMPLGEHVFPDIQCNAHDFNDLIENKCFMKFMTAIRREIYNRKVVGFGDDVRSRLIAEGLEVSFVVFDDIEREMFQEGTPEPEDPSRGE